MTHRIQVLSDLHLEASIRTRVFQIPDVGADVLVLAGDIHNGLQGLDYLAKHNSRYHRVIYVPGNHEFYGHDIETLHAQMKDKVKDLGMSNVHVVNNEVVSFRDIDFVCSTLWTDFQRRNPVSMEIARVSMRDYEQIMLNGKLILPYQILRIFNESRRFVEGFLESRDHSRRVVVVSHSAPSYRSRERRFNGDELTPSFCSDLDRVVAKANIWIHGHVHESFDYYIGDCRVVCNPKGNDFLYNNSFDKDLVVAI